MSATTPPVIDMHAHLHVPERAAIAAALPGASMAREATKGWIGPDSLAHTASIADVLHYELTDVDARLSAMDAMGVSMQAVSLAPAQYYYWADPAAVRDMVETSNAATADLVSGHPERFVGIADVAIGHPELAAEQLARAVGHWGLRGVQISSRAGRFELSAPQLDPFWHAAEALGVPVIIHPLGCSLGPRLAHRFLNNTVGQPVEHAVALSHLIFSGVLDRFPKLKVLAVHGGGYLPMYIGRSDHAWSVRPESRGCIEPPSSYLPRLYVDSLVYTGDALRHLIDVVGVDHIVTGTDYPYDMGVRDPLQRIDSVPGLTARERSAIFHGTASRLLGLDAPVAS
jgi:aminocarboxymuconate-semialdehyde decarboxylase